MEFIPINKTIIEKNGKDIEVFVVPAMTISKDGEKEKKIPHPSGNSSLIFSTKEKAIAAIKRSGLFSFDDFKNNVKTKKKYSGNSDINEALISLLDDSYNSVVASAIFSLGEIKSETAIKPLINFLNHTDNAIAQNTIDALAKIGESSIFYLVETLDDESWEKRNAAAKCLGDMAQYKVMELEKSVEPLIYLLNDKNPVIRSTVALSLAKIYKLLNI